MAITLNGTTGITTPDVDSTADISANGLTVGRGAGAVASNTAVGASALAANTSGSSNTAVGTNALAANTTAVVNTAVGWNALPVVTTGSYNTAAGSRSLYSNTTARYNSAFGEEALYSNTTGENNTAIGMSALLFNTTASSNTAVGYQAGYTNSTGQYNVFLGDSAGYSSTSDDNTYLGRSAGYSTTGTSNTFLGRAAGSLVTTGSKNTIIGKYNGNQDGLDIRTAGNYVVLSDGDGSWGARWYPGISWYQKNNSSTWGVTSDVRIKENIVNVADGLAVVNALRPVEFDYKIGDKRHDVGFIAQEYQKVLPNQITEEPSHSEEVTQYTNGEPVLGIQQNLMPYLVKAIQELKAEFDAYRATHP